MVFMYICEFCSQIVPNFTFAISANIVVIVDNNAYPTVVSSFPQVIRKITDPKLPNILS